MGTTTLDYDVVTEKIAVDPIPAAGVEDGACSTIRFLLADDDLFVTAVTALLENDGRFEILGRATAGRRSSLPRRVRRTSS